MLKIRTALAACLSLTATASAADLRVDVINAVAPGTSVTRISGDPGRQWMLYLSMTEAPTPIGDMITLSIKPVRQFNAGYVIAGTLDASGQSSFSFDTVAALAGGHMSFQAASVAPTVQVSNLCRASYIAPNAFGTTALPSAGVSFLGDLFPLGGGRMLSLGGAATLVSTFDPDLQELAPSGLMPTSYVLSTRAQLADRRVLVCGGIDTSGMPSAEAFLYDPASSTSASAGRLNTARAGAASVRLPSGKILVVGGLSTLDITNPVGFFDGLLNTSELFDPAAGTFTNGPTMTEKKALATATLLNNGQVLVSGGLGVIPILGIPYVSNTAYVYSSGSNTFGFFPKTFTGGRLFHDATKMADGRMLISGGMTADLSGVITSGDPTQIAFTTLGTTAIYSTSGAGSFSVGPVLHESRAFHTATVLQSGTVLLVGGASGTLDLGTITTGMPVLPTPLATSELLTGSSARIGPNMTSARAGASALLNPIDGRVVIVGGGPLAIELYQP